MYEGIIKDISGGGVKLATNKRLNINDEVLIEFTLPGSVNFSLNGVVTRNVKNGANFDVGISFKDIDTNSREKIVSFIFAEQRKLLKRGLME
jgi:PilZ domain.